MRTRRRAVVSLLAVLALGLSCAHAQVYPDRPVRLVVPTTAGGGTDWLARLTAQGLSRLLKQSFVVENKPDASGIVGTHAVATAAPDGYTLLFNASTHLITPFFNPDTPFDAQKDFTPITEVGKNPYVLCVIPSMGIGSLAEFVRFAKANPGAVQFGVAGVGTPDHVALELFQQAAGIQTLIVPYKGGGPALMGALSGVVQAVMLPPSSVRAHVEAGKLKALAVTSAEPSDAMPGTPTIASSGYADYQFYSWYGLWGPKGMPADRVQVIQGATAQLVGTDEFRRTAAEMGAVPVGSSPAAFAEFVDKEKRRYGKLISERDLLRK